MSKVKNVERKNIESVKNRVSTFAMYLKRLLTDDTTGCLYRIVDKSDLNSIFNTFDIFSFDIFYFRHFFFRPILYQSMNFHIIYTEDNADPTFLIIKSDGVKNYVSFLNFKFQHTVHLKQSV